MEHKGQSLSRKLSMAYELYGKWRPQRDLNPCFRLERLVTAWDVTRRDAVRDGAPKLPGNHTRCSPAVPVSGLVSGPGTRNLAFLPDLCFQADTLVIPRRCSISWTGYRWANREGGHLCHDLQQDEFLSDR